MTSLPMLPAILVDMAGSFIIIVLSFLSLRYAWLLIRRQPENFLWGFLFYFCLTLGCFSVSRALGHLLKQILLIFGYTEQWHVLAPYTGGFNTLLMTSLAAVTIYYHKGIEGYQAIQKKADSLRIANEQLEVSADKLLKLNENLEKIVENRTQKLSESEKKFRNFFTNSKDMVYFCDATTRIGTMNPAGFEMLGYSMQQAPQLGLQDIFYNPEDLEKYTEALTTMGFVQDLEVEFVRAEGTVIYVLLSATAIFDENQKFSGCEGIAKDLTRVRTMMKQLASSEKMASVGQMAAGVAHEVNTPLGVILGYAQLMMDDFSPESEEGQNLEVIERQAKACRKIVADLLKFSRQSESARENILLNEILEDVLAVTEHSLNMDHIKVSRDFDEDLPIIVGDPEKLRQVFVNLVNNARHAMEEQGGGKLFLSCHYEKERDQVTATIRDTGHGIPKKVMAQIFDPFFTTKSVGKGTGLGLSVSYGIIKEHGGVIEVESPVQTADGELKGTALHVKLPVPPLESAIVIKDNHREP
ncbi:PAS domain S-box protein [Desulforhopalus vacuolatus]|uniref:two-component system sensor histidine kinase NtrB n=1 Tax=Desulforhopalus vacuolatus TaxID=40414 RepID=UPI0019647357|nr:ATP-binding protein [Desulforhopalus vacuolatus]MBM9518932.1 PAS domain S-box protein [Desulforhopalus vacuolatus]